MKYKLKRILGDSKSKHQFYVLMWEGGSGHSYPCDGFGAIVMNGTTIATQVPFYSSLDDVPFHYGNWWVAEVGVNAGEVGV